MPRDLPQKMPYFPAEDESEEAQQAAQTLAEEWCLKGQRIDHQAYLAIVSSSIKAYEEGKCVKVLSDHPDHLTLHNGFGDAMELDEEAAIKLYQDLAEALDLPCQRNCPKCGDIMDGDVCEECADGESSGS